MPELILRGLKDTQRVAERLVRELPQGAVLLLTGPLGAGKTTLVSFLARALGFRGRVTSPTYTLMHEYPTPKGVLLHVDLYRLASPEDAWLLGLDERIESAYLTAVEWGRAEQFPSSLEVNLTPLDEGRRLVLLAHGPTYASLLQRLRL